MLNEQKKTSGLEKDRNGLTEKEFLDSYNPDNFDKPSISTDILVFTIENNELKLLLTKRESHPFIGKWALPGGFVKINENAEDAAKRRLKEETGLTNVYLEQLYTNSDVCRDPRMRVISTSYIALTDRKQLHPVAGDDTAEVAWFSVNKTIKNIDSEGTIYSDLILENSELGVSIKGKIFDIPEVNGIITSYKSKALQTGDDILAFDHIDIVNMAIDRIRNKIEYTPIAFNLVNEFFTLPELQKVYEIILGKKLYKANFRNKIMPMIIDIDSYLETSRRPAKLYKYNPLWNVKNEREVF